MDDKDGQAEKSVGFFRLRSDSSMDDKDHTLDKFFELIMRCSDSSMDDKDDVEGDLESHKAEFRFLYGR